MTDRVIYKYQLPTVVVEPTSFEVPRGSRVLSAQLQNEQGVQVWIEQPQVDLAEWTERYAFWCLLTGEPFDDYIATATFLSTIQAGPIVLHIYYQKLAG
jgi:hypothetical protein